MNNWSVIGGNKKLMYILDRILQRLQRNTNKILLQVQFVLKKQFHFRKQEKKRKKSLFD